jgi:CheY-like chemotaxis protein
MLTELLLEGPSQRDALEPWQGVPAPEPAQSPARARRRVLVVDDDPAVRDIIARLLVEEGYQVILARHGGEALDLVRREEPFDLLITDIRMPIMDGWELSGRLRERWPALPVLYISGFDVELTHGATLGGTNGAFLRKPFDLDELSRLVVRLLGGV